MATGTWAWFGKGLQTALFSSADLDASTKKIALASSSYTPDPDAHDFWDDVSANEVTGTNWAAGGQTVTVTNDIDTSNNRVRLFATDVSVATVTLSDGKHAILYHDTGTPSTSYLIGYCTFDTALAPSAGTLTIDNDGTNGTLRVAY